jgi:carbamoyl-phosphate synthase large subunit
MTAVLITGAGGPLGVNFTRSLRASGAGFRIVGTDANRWHLPLSLADVTYRIPHSRDRDGYRAALAAIAGREGVAAIIPTHPVEVRQVAALRDAGELEGIGTALPASAVLEIADDKRRTQERLAAAGIAVPRSLRLDAPADVDVAFAELAVDGGPIWVRGAGAPGLGIGGAALPARSAEVARAWIEHHRGWGKMAASELLPGANLTWMALFDRGGLIAAGSRERLEYVLPHVSPSGITGAPAVSRTIDRAEVAAIGEAAVRAIDTAPHGAYFVDLSEDRGGAPRVTEINAGRCGTTVHFYTEAGCNFPHLLVRLALGERLEPAADPNRCVPPDLYWVRTLDCGPALVRGDAGFDEFPEAP